MSNPVPHAGLKIGSRDAYLFGAYMGMAIAPASTHAAIDEAVAASTDRDADAFSRSVIMARAALAEVHEASHAPRAIFERAAENHLTIPSFEPSEDWVARTSAAVELAIDASGTRTPYELGLESGALSRTLFVLRTLATMRAASPANATLQRQIASLLKSLDDGAERLRKLAFIGASEVLHLLDDPPDFVSKISPDGNNDWIRTCLVALGQMGQQFVNELPVATALPTQGERDLYQRILREPARDDLREQYAALARRRNDPRARLIELQLTTRDLRRKGIAPGYGDLMRDASTLIEANPEWTDDVVALGVDAIMHRGFVEEIHCDVSTFLARIDELIAIAPILHVRFTDAVGRVAEIAACPALTQLQSLSFSSNRISDADITALARSPYVEKLRWLDLGWNKITDVGVDALAAGNTKSLVCVDLGSNPCTDPTDEKVYYDDTRYGWRDSPRGVVLEAANGPLAWLHPSVAIWPPPMGIV